MRREQLDPSNVPPEFDSEFLTGKRAHLLNAVVLMAQALGYAHKQITARLFEFRPPKTIQGMVNTQRPDIVASNGKHRLIGTVVLPEDLPRLEGRLMLLASACQMYRADFAIACPAELAPSLRGRMELWGIKSNYFWPL